MGWGDAELDGGMNRCENSCIEDALELGKDVKCDRDGLDWFMPVLEGWSDCIPVVFGRREGAEWLGCNCPMAPPVVLGCNP